MKRIAVRSRTLSVATVIVVAIGSAIWFWQRHPIDPLVEGARSLDYRPAEARLAGSFEYRPVAPVTRGAEREADRLPPAMQSAVIATPVDDLRATGRSSLMLRQWDAAANAFDDAIRRETQREQLSAALAAATDAGLLTDLAAAHHAAGRYTNEPHHYVIAAEAAERAWSIAATPEIAWNRALAIESLHLRRLARMAWRDYLRLDPDSPWAAEVDARMERMAEPTTWQLWDKALPQLERAVLAGDQPTIARIVNAFRGRARHECEQKILPAWAKSFEKGPVKAESLALCRAVGRVLRQTTGESMLHDTIETIDAADLEKRARIIDALTIYGDAALARGLDDRSVSCGQFAAALSGLRASRLALAHKAAMYIGDCKRFEKDAWVDGVDPRRYPALIAQLHWVRGLARVRTGRPESGIEDYEKAFAGFTSLGERENVAAMSSSFAEAYEYLGDRERAWRFHFAALEELDASGSTQAQALEVLRLAAQFSLRERLPHTALLFINHFLLERQTLPVMRFRMLLLRAEIYRSFGDDAAAARDVLQARAVMPNIPDENVRAEFARAPDVVRSRLAETRDRAARDHILRDAIDYAQKRAFSFRLAQLSLDQGVEHARAGNLDAAKRTLYEAAAQIEQERETLTDDDRRGTLVAARRAIYDALIEVLCRRGEYGEAFDIAERSRARSLLDRIARSATPLRDLTRVGAIAAELPPRTALIELAQTNGALVTWIVSGAGVRVVGVPIDADELQRKVDQLRLGGQHRDESAARDAAAALYDVLVRPWHHHARDFERLVFVPDDRLAGVPFAALLDRTSGRFLIERHVVSVAPSANIFAACLTRDRERVRKEGPVLVVAPSTSTASAGDKVLLRGTGIEAERIARQYEDAELLDGALATSATFLQRAPQARIIHFGGHSNAVRRGVPRLRFAARADGSADTLGVQDICTMRLDNTRLVVLSACVSAADHSAALQGTSSLARAFLAAGAPAVIATYWDVADEAAAELSRRLHVHLARGHQPSDALRLAQLQMLAARDATSARIGSWAAFAVHGGTEN